MSKKTIALLALTVILTGLVSGCGHTKESLDPAAASESTPTATVSAQSAATPSPSNTLLVTTATATPDPDSPKGYVLATPSQAAFVRWTEKDKQLSGQMQISDHRDSKISSSSALKCQSEWAFRKLLVRH